MGRGTYLRGHHDRAGHDQDPGIAGVGTMSPGIDPGNLYNEVADMQSNGVWVLDAGKSVGDKMEVLRKINTGRGAYGLYPSRNANYDG